MRTTSITPIIRLRVSLARRGWEILRQLRAPFAPDSSGFAGGESRTTNRGRRIDVLLYICIYLKLAAAAVKCELSAETSTSSFVLVSEMSQSETARALPRATTASTTLQVAPSDGSRGFVRCEQRESRSALIKIVKLTDTLDANAGFFPGIQTTEALI